MSWDKVDKAHRQKYGRDHVACLEPEEREYLRMLIAIHFPFFRKSKILPAIDLICQEMESPCERTAFLKRVEEILSLEEVLIAQRTAAKETQIEFKQESKNV